MDAETKWRLRLLVSGPTAILAGIGLSIYVYFGWITPYPKCYPDCMPDGTWDWTYPVGQVVSPLLVVLGAAALVVRWWLARVLDLPRGGRSASVTLFVGVATFVAVVAYFILFVVLTATVALASCNLHGC